jgi:hypothetical protein
MVFTLPSVSVTFGSRSKDEPEKKSPQLKHPLPTLAVRSIRLWR